MLNKAPGGIYYKWLVANRLGNLARELLDQREGRRKRRFARLTGRDWQPPAEVSAYLESGFERLICRFSPVSLVGGAAANAIGFGYKAGGRIS